MLIHVAKHETVHTNLEKILFVASLSNLESGGIAHVLCRITKTFDAERQTEKVSEKRGMKRGMKST